MVGNACFSQSKHMTICERVPGRPKFGALFLLYRTSLGARSSICAHFFLCFLVELDIVGLVGGLVL